MNRKYMIFYSAFLLIFALSCKDRSAEPEIIEYEIKNKPGFTLKITDQGSEPRKLLQFKYKEGYTQIRKMVMKMDVQMTMNGNTSPLVSSPPVIMPIISTVEKVGENGVAKIKYEIKDITVGDDPNANAELVDRLKEQYSKIKSISCTSEFDPSGTSTRPECEFDGDAALNIVQYIDQMMENSGNNIFIPTYPVGVGAKWEISSPSMESGGIVVSYKSVQELVKLEGDIAEIDSVLTQTAAEQEVKFPGTDFNTKIESFNADGTGKMEINFNELLPIGDANSKAEITTIIQLPDSNDNKVITEMDMNIKFTD